MAISHALLKEKKHKRCILCRNAIDRVTIGSLCNSCKDGFAANFAFARGIAKEFAM